MMQTNGRLNEDQIRILKRAERGLRLFLPLTSASTVDTADSLVKAGYLEKGPGSPLWLFYAYDLTPAGRSALDGYK